MLSNKIWEKTKQLSLKSKISIGCFVLLLILFGYCLPDPLFDKPTSFVVESSEGHLLGAAIASDGQWRFPKADSLPDKFKKCIVTFEDKRFYHHPGVDIRAIARALKQNSSKGRTVSGGSTLSMQVIRLATGNRRTFLNKVLESIRALRLELSYSKDEILSIYAANAPFGTNVVGLEAAAWRYFGRSPFELSWGECAALAVLPNSPSLVHPGKNSERLLQKRNRLIDALVKEKIINSTEAALAKLEPVPDKPLPLPELAPHLLGLIRKDYNAKRIASTRIRSSLRQNLQQQVNSILESHHQRLAANQVNNLCALVLDVETGQALAYAGNIYSPDEPEIESHVDVIQAPRSPGSTLKPLLYAAMLNEGMILPNSLVPDIPTQIAGYQPNNYDLGYDGAVPASRALARSLNVPAVKMLQQYRYERFHRKLQTMGISTLTHNADFYGLSLILGGCETSMWQLSGVYASMARTLNHYKQNNNKYSPADWHPPVYCADETETRKIPLEQHSGIDAASLYSTFVAMNEVMRPGEELLWKQFSASQQIAWKTGTSFGFRDAWAIGLTPRFVVAVWAGNTDGEGRPGLTGIDAAAPVLFDIFRLLPPSSEGWFEAPVSDMVSIDICKESGFRASDLCSLREKLFVPRSCLKAAVCNYHKLIHLDQAGFQVTSNCQSPSNMIHKSWFVLPPSMEYYYKVKNYSYKELPPFREGCQSNDYLSAPMELIYPKNNAAIYVPLEIDGSRGKVVFQAAHRKANETIYWHLDNQYIGSTKDLHQMGLSPLPGNHQITLIDQEGNRLQQQFTILKKDKT